MTERLGSMQRPVWIPQQFAREQHDVCLTSADDGVRLFGRRNQADRAGHHTSVTANALGKRHLVAGADHDLLVVNRSGGRTVNEVHTVGP
jgi:hypothetical protein